MMNPIKREEEVVQYLKESHLFKHLPEESLLKLVELSHFDYYPENATLLEEGQMNNKVFFLIEGTVGVYSNGARVSQLKRKGDIFGEMSVISAWMCTASIIAETPVRVFTIDVQRVGRYKDTHPVQTHDMLYRVFSMALTEKLAASTAQAQAYESTQNLLEESQHLLDETHTQLTQLAQLATLGELARGIVYQLQYPVQAAEKEVRHLSNQSDISSQTQEALSSIHSHLQHASSFIEHLQSLTNQQQFQQKQPTHLESIVQDSLSLTQELFKQNDIEIQAHLDEDLPQVWVARTQIEQVLTSLLIYLKDVLVSKKITSVSIVLKHEHLYARMPDAQQWLSLAIETDPQTDWRMAKQMPFVEWQACMNLAEQYRLSLSISQGILLEHQIEAHVLQSDTQVGFHLKIPLTHQKNNQEPQTTNRRKGET